MYSYVCFICHDTRTDDEIIDFYHEGTQSMLRDAESGELDSETLTDEFFQQCFFKIRYTSKFFLFNSCFRCI